MEDLVRDDIYIERIADRFDPRVLLFTRQVCLENGAQDSYWDQEYSHSETFALYADLDHSKVEEIWKFGPRKWLSTEFDNLECLMWREKVIGLSGCRAYSGRMLRVSMHLYTLREHRKVCRGFQFAQDGLFARHLEYARNRKAFDALFMTVYAHSRKLAAHAKNLGSRKLALDGSPALFLNDLIPCGEPIPFHGVPQYFFIYPLAGGFKFDGIAPDPEVTF